MSQLSGVRWVCWVLLTGVGISATTAWGAKPGSEETAREVDRLLAEEVFQPDTKLAPHVDDAAFLRRVWLDLVGDIPTPEHITAYVLDPAADKRAKVVDELLANPQYGQNWARYWRDVVLARKIEDRAMIVANPLVTKLTDSFNENKSWAKIATEFITATGNVRENGATAIELAQDGRTEETTAEVSRIFLGIQIQCAQCHDHKTDRWKREQFHEFAAFFPRVAVRPIQSPVERSFEVISDDRPDLGRKLPADAQGRRGRGEHYMPDLQDPTAEGTKMQPKYFLTSAKLPFGSTDAERRGMAAKVITHSPWFATAFVNRIWGELVGEGFYEGIDDIGPDRAPSAPKTVELLSRGFVASGYDVKWLFRTICATEAYQRESRPRREVTGTPFVATVAQPLRSDQLFNAILTALDLSEPESQVNRRGKPAEMKAAYGSNATARAGFEVAFGYDPSDPRETVNASIPQALAMMNGVRINVAVRAVKNDTMLGRLLANTKDNSAVVDELYLRTLSREPTEKERGAALEFCKDATNRSAVFEDLLWALVNSSEFSHRR
ncbi:MAG: DUF1549 domain-containing protein [Pirellulales bacterium]